MLKKIFISLVILIFLLGILEAYSFLLTHKENEEFKLIAKRINKTASDYKTEYKLLKPFQNNIYRNSTIIENTTKQPILWFGCSFAEGCGLDDNLTPCYKISKLTKRSCINKAKGTTGTQFMYYQLKQNDLKEKYPEVDYIIYIFIWDHLQRLYNYQVNPLIYMHNLRYKITKNGLKEINPQFNPLYSSFLVKRILNRKIKLAGKKERQNFKLFNEIMKESALIAKEKYPNSKFIMIEFPEVSYTELPNHEIKELETYGITVLRVKDFIPTHEDIQDKKYWLEDEMHPSSDFWDLFLTKIVEQHINE